MGDNKGLKYSQVYVTHVVLICSIYLLCGLNVEKYVLFISNKLPNSNTADVFQGM